MELWCWALLVLSLCKTQFKQKKMKAAPGRFQELLSFLELEIKEKLTFISFIYTIMTNELTIHIFGFCRGECYLIIELFVIFFILLPTSIMIHELGHALPIVLSTKSGEANIFLGTPRKENKLAFSIGKIHFYIGWGFSGFCFISNYKDIPPLSSTQRLVVDAGGPVFSLVAGIIAYGVSISSTGSFYYAYPFAAVNFCLFLTSVIPVTYPGFAGALAGYPSDGLRIYQNIRGKAV